jgi:hypothetical protein
VNGGVIDGDAALGHHLLKVPQAEIVGQIPAHAEQDHRTIKMPALEHLKQKVCDGASACAAQACLSLCS